MIDDVVDEEQDTVVKLLGQELKWRGEKEIPRGGDLTDPHVKDWSDGSAPAPRETCWSPWSDL